MDAERRIGELRQQIEHHNFLYYVEANPELDDREFDRLMQELQQLESEHPEFDRPDSPSHKVGGATIEGFVTVPHREPMLSIDNAFDIDTLRKFETRIRKTLGDDPIKYSVEYKIDGVALSLIYRNGSLDQALTRGDGQQGDDVTHNARTVLGVPLRLRGDDWPSELEVRGEAYISKEDFSQLRAAQEASGETPFANPRNTAAGGLKVRDPKLCQVRRLRFLAHGFGTIEGAAEEFTNFEALLNRFRDWGVPITPDVRWYNSIDEVIAGVEELAENIHALPFEVDGIVIKVDTFAERAELGATSKSPSWVIAYKWERYFDVTRVADIQIQVGKTGALTPVAFLEPVEIDGTTVSRVSLHNRDEIERLSIQIGDWVVVEKAGKIIPHVMRVEVHRRADGEQTAFHYPDECPECGTEAVQDEGGVYIRCPNPGCPGKLREILRFFSSRAAMDIEGLGIKLIEQFLEEGLLEGLADIYRLRDHRDKLLEMERLAEKSVDNLLAGIEKSKQQPPWRLLTGLSIRHVGAQTARVLCDHFGALDEIAKQSEEELAAVDEVGPVIAQAVSAAFKAESGTQLLGELKSLGLNLGEPRTEAERQAAAEGALTGKTIVVTGALKSMTREEMHERIREAGGKPSGSVSKKTDYLVVGDKPGSKAQKAESLGVEIVTEDQFAELIGA